MLLTLLLPSLPELGILPLALTLSVIEPLIINIRQKTMEGKLTNSILNGAITETVV